MSQGLRYFYILPISSFLIMPIPFSAKIVHSSDVFKHDLFQGKVLFCTGGGSGICRSMTEAMLRHGAKATIVGRRIDVLTQSAKELTETTGQEVFPAQADVRKPEMLKNAVAKTIEKFGRIDYVICGAGGNFLAPISGLSENAFRTVVEIDTVGTYNTIKATIPYVRHTHGAYIHVSATMQWKGTPYQAHLSAAKAGVDALSAVLAVEEGPHGVRSNVIAPGAIGKTEGASRLSPQGADVNKMIQEITPLGRFGHVYDVENATIFLFSNASAFITGQIIAVDGGNSNFGLNTLPYPKSVLDPKSVRNMIKARM